MGRVRVKLKRLESTSNRQITYCKRKSGILKKAREISVLCDIDILLLMFSPTGKPTLFLGERSKFDEIIAKYAQLTPQERAKRKSESLDVLRKTLKKLNQDMGVQEILDASDPSVEELQNQVKVLQSPLTKVEKRLSLWSNPNEITETEHLIQMENTLKELLNAIHTQKLQNTLHVQFCMGNEQEGQSLPFHPAYKSQHMQFPEELSFQRQGDIVNSGETSIARSSHILDHGKESQGTTAILDASVLDDLTSIACLRQKLSVPYSYDPFDSLNLLERNGIDPQSELNVKGYLMDYETEEKFNLPMPVDSTNISWDCAAGTDFDEMLYMQQENARGDCST